MMDTIALSTSEANRSDEASRPALIFLHYFGGSSRSWTEVIARLAPRFGCHALDLRGFGESDSRAGGYAVNDYADDVAASIRAANIESYVLVGHSMGGKIALALAARRPANLRALVLLAPSPPTPEPIPEAERKRLLDTHGDRRAAEATFGKITAHALPAPVFERCVDDQLRCSPEAWRAWLEGGSREDISSDVARIDVPVLVVAGEMDDPLTADLLRHEVVWRIAGARLAVLPDVGHLLPLENPTTVADLIVDHCVSARPSDPPELLTNNQLDERMSL